MGLFLYIDIDAFFASVEQSINPLLMGQPVMVGGLKGERGVVACPNYEARARGVGTGTSLHEAARLIPGGIFLKGDYNRYQYYSDRFYEILSHYSPEVERISQDEACLNLRGITRDFETAIVTAREMQQSVHEGLLLSTSIGVGPSRVIAKIASEYQKPMGLTVVSDDNVKAFLSPLPIRKIPGVGPITAKILTEMGIQTAGQLAAVPEKYLKTIFGINGLKISAYSRGEDGIPLCDRRIIRSISRETGFAEDITDRDILLCHYYYLLERASAKLRALSKKAATVKIKFRYADFQTIEASTPINPPSHDQNTIFPLIQAMFRQTFRRTQGIRLIGLVLTGLKNHAEGISFLNDGTEKKKRLLAGLDLIRRRNGFFSLVTGRTLALSSRYKRRETGYELRTPSLSQ
jgi:DNA polymerase-4